MTQYAKITAAAWQRVIKSILRVERMPGGSTAGASTYRPGTTLQLLGKLSEDLVYGGSAGFKQWAATDPSDSGSTEAELEYDDEQCFAWSYLKPGEKIVAGSRVTLDRIAGRWYVSDSDNCPEEAAE